MKTGLFSFLFLLLIFTLPSFSQDFGDVSDEELQLTGVAEDPEANIVILFDRGEIKISPHFKLEMEIHKRIKILTEAGKEYANVKIRYWHEDKIKNLEAASYSPDGKKHELDDDNIYEEGTKKWKDKVFAIPGVDVGSVIEYKYTLYSDYITNLEPWFFQSNEFTKLSEICVYLPLGFKYSALEKNLINYNTYKNSELARNPFDFREKCTKYTWRLTDVPPIKDEPYMFAKHDYYAQILFQLVAYRDAYQNVTLAKRWDNVAERVWDNLEDYIDQDGGLEDLAKEKTADCSTDEEKARTLYNFVRSQIKTTKNIGFLSNGLKEPQDVYKEKAAGSNEKNLLLINLLNHIGLEARPLLISTRSHGHLSTTWVQLMQFNRLITYLKIGGKTFYLNPGETYSPFGVLTPEYNVEEGLLIDKTKGQIVGIKAPKTRGNIKVKTNALIKEDGSLYCSTDINYTKINAVLKREDIDRDNLSKYIEDDFKDIFADAVIDSFEFVDLDSVDKPLTIKVSYHVPDYVENAGQLIIFEPPLLLELKKNPFVREKRTFAVDFKHQTSHSETVKMFFPKSMKISEIPQKTSFKMPKLKFTKIYFDSDNTIEITRSFRLGRTHFGSSEYAKLKQIYEKIVQSDQDKIVLNKI